MVRIGVVSDSHGIFRHVGRMRVEFGRIDWLLHAGDHMKDAARIAVNLGVDPAQVRAVAGNCDFPTTKPDEVLIEVAGVKLYMTHGHHHGVKSGLQRILYRGQEVGARVVIFGHTHVPVLTEVDGVLLLNPGSISQPRRQEDRPSCALLELAEGQVRARHIFFA